MFRTSVVALLWLIVQVSHPFSFDIVVGRDDKLEFYLYKTLTHTQVIPTYRIESVTYDPVHNRVIFSHYKSLTESISSFDLSTRTIQRLYAKTWGGYYIRVIYEPVTQVFYFKEGFSIYKFSIDPRSGEEADKAYMFMALNRYCYDIAVDSCGGYIYWITQDEIGRARLDGTERETLIESEEESGGHRSLAIDQQTQKIYWTEKTRRMYELVIKSANFNGENREVLYFVRDVEYVISLTVSKDFIYWQKSQEKGIWQLLKTHSDREAKQIHTKSIATCELCNRVAANYTIQEQMKGIKNCKALKSLIPVGSKSECTVSMCQNYCFQGECSVSDGHPTCSCKAGYSGERCEVNACHDYCLHGGVCSLNEENKRVCQCTADYDGERCDVSICKDYCLRGNCSVGADGLPECSCITGYSGERCEVNACLKHCLNAGVCSLNEENEPVCECTAAYNGERCEVPANKDNSCDAGNSGQGTISACHQFCLNNGVCSLNEASEPVCQCTADYEGDRCEVSVNRDFCFQAACGVSADGQPTVTITLGKGVQSTCASTVPEDRQDTKKLTEFK